MPAVDASRSSPDPPQPSSHPALSWTRALNLDPCPLLLQGWRRRDIRLGGVVVGACLQDEIGGEHLSSASAVVGMQILMSAYDESVAVANLVIAFLEQRPGVLTRVDTVGWYEGSDLILEEPN